MSKGDTNTYMSSSVNIPDVGVGHISSSTSKVWVGGDDPTKTQERQYTMSSSRESSSFYIVYLNGNEYITADVNPPPAVGVNEAIFGELHADAIDDLLDQYAGAQAQWSSSLAEADESLAYVIQKGKVFLRKFKPFDEWKKLRGYSSRPDRLLLEWKFAMRPLITDIAAACELFDPFKNPYAKLKSKQNRSITSSGDYGQWTRKTLIGTDVRCTVAFDSSGAPKKLEVPIDPGIVLWERTGWSWAVDYFTNMGNFIGGRANIAALSNVIGGQIWISDFTQEENSAHSYSYTGYEDLNWRLSLFSNATLQNTSLKRYPLNQSIFGLSSFFALGSVKGFKNVQQAITILAACTSRAGK